MFSMLYGGWPRGEAPSARAGDTAAAAEDERAAVAADERAAVAAAVRAQVAAGLDLVTDGVVRWPDPAAALLGALEAGDVGPGGMLVRAWRETSALPEASGVPVAATVTGPYSLATHAGRDEATRLGSVLAGELRALADAGCPFVVVDEPEAISIAGDEDARQRFRAAQAALLGDEPPTHTMLAIAGGSAWEAGAETILAAPHRSYLFDLVAGPDNWYLVRAVPGDRGVVCAALRAPSHEDQAPLLVWAARYAASSNGRGLDRVGLANASPLVGLSPDEATRAAGELARGARLAALEPDEAIAAGLDPRTFRQGPGRGARRGSLRGR